MNLQITVTTRRDLSLHPSGVREKKRHTGGSASHSSEMDCAIVILKALHRRLDLGNDGLSHLWIALGGGSNLSDES